MSGELRCEMKNFCSRINFLILHDISVEGHIRKFVIHRKKFLAKLRKKSVIFSVLILFKRIIVKIV